VRGWRGINVEPLQEKFDALKVDRPIDINVQAVISDHEGLVELFEAGGASTVETGTLKNIKINNAMTGTSQVRALTMDKLMEQNLPANQTISFLKIDVEGHEEKVLKSMNLSSVRPFVIMIESVIPWKGTPAFENWEPLLIEAGYKLGLDYRNNRYYVDKAFPEISFKGPEELLAKYRVFIISEPGNKYRLSYMAIESVFAQHPKLKHAVLKIIRKLYPFVSKHLSSFVK
jgi:FkbM family methyltransferase